MDDLETRRNSSSGRLDTVRLNDAAPPVAVPPGHVGPVVLPGSGRLIYWTGRVAIGLRHERPQRHDLITSSALWVQDVMLARRGELKAA